MRAPFYVFICKWFDREVKYACPVLNCFRGKKTKMASIATKENIKYLICRIAWLILSI